MSEHTRPHDPQGSATAATGRKPWKAPRLNDLDDIEVAGMQTDGMGNGVGIGTANSKLRAIQERHDTDYDLHYGANS